MEITTSSLQEIINKRAEAKAKQEIEVLKTALSVSGILQIEGFWLKEEERNRELRYCISDNSFSSEDNILTVLYKQKVAKYIISETKDFVSKVEKLVEQTDNLLNIAENY